LADQLATMIVAGHETTAGALFWSLYLLASAPTIQDRLAAEVAVADLGPDNAAAALPMLLYTRAVVREALWLYPPAFILARQALRADVAGGIIVTSRPVVFIAPGFCTATAGCARGPKSSTPPGFCPPRGRPIDSPI
jgi:cytochrome P450